MVPMDSLDTKEFLTDLAEADRLLSQATDRLRNAMFMANKGDVKKTATASLSGVGDMIRQVRSKLEQAARLT